MGFSNQERINFNSKALAAAVVDANPVAQWYETRNPFAFMLSGSKILLQLSSIPAAANLATARTNASNNPTLLSDLSQNSDAVRLTAVAGTNNSTYIAYSTYNDSTSAILDNWMQPQLVPQSSGAASIGYAIQLYDGNPSSGGSLVSTTDGTSGTGQNKSVGWVFNYAGGLLFLSDDFKGSVSDPYIVGFRYVGTTANSLTSSDSVTISYTADETLAVGDILRFVTSSDGGGLTPGRVVKANATNTNGSDAFGIAASSATQGNAVNVLCVGNVSIKFTSTLASSNNGKTVFLSTISGQATIEPPNSSGNVVMKLGKLTGANGSTTTPNVFLDIDEIMVLG